MKTSLSQKKLLKLIEKVFFFDLNTEKKRFLSSKSKPSWSSIPFFTYWYFESPFKNYLSLSYKHILSLLSLSVSLSVSLFVSLSVSLSFLQSFSNTHTMTHTPGLSVCKYVCWNKKQECNLKRVFLFPSSEMLNIRSHYAWLDTISKVTPLQDTSTFWKIIIFLPSTIRSYFRLHISNSFVFFNRFLTRSIIIHCNIRIYWKG